MQRIKGGGISGNYIDYKTGGDYWISGVKKAGTNRRCAGGGKIVIEDDVRIEYEQLVGGQE